MNTLFDVYLLYSTTKVKNMNVERRKCISHGEDFSKIPKFQRYKPKYFKYYSLEGCMLECRAAYSLDMCNCLPYYYPNFRKNSACDVEELQCLANISGRNMLMHPVKGLSNDIILH